ncbi:MAG: hypothetical protein ACREOD_10240 [Candidatus Dormibacteria bacterium]
MRNPGSRELRRRQARMDSQQRQIVREQSPPPRREEMMRRGGLLEGLAPSVVGRLTLVSTVVTLLLIGAGVVGLLVEIGQRDLLLGVVVVLVAVVMSGIGASVAAPAMRAARRDRKVPPRTIQGQLVGASLISPTPTLATLALNVGRNVEQFRVRAELFEKLKGGATVVGITVTPTLNYVQTLAVIRRDRLATMSTPPVTRQVRIAVWLPLVSLAALIAGLAVGCLIGVFLPLGRGFGHALAALLLAVALAGGVALGARWLGQRLISRLGLQG